MSAPFLRVVPPSPVYHGPAWHARRALYLSHSVAVGEEPVPAACCHCGMDIAIPPKAKGYAVACIYCGMERGEIAPAEVEPFWRGGSDPQLNADGSLRAIPSTPVGANRT